MPQVKTKKREKFFKKLSKLKSFKTFEDFFYNLSSDKIDFLISYPSARKVISKILEKAIKRRLVKDKKFSRQVQIDKFYMTMAIVTSLNRLMDRAKDKPKYRKIITESIGPKLIKISRKNKETVDRFEKKHGFTPPGFLTVSPTRFCNLKCTGCYANSSAANAEKLDFDVVDRIITEKTKSWASWFTVISGGEPFLYEDKGKTILDIFKKHPDNFFLVYTNGTLITKEVAEKLAELGNVTPAISVEGFEKETDERRGKGVHKRILQAFENLKEAGVPFGVSITATNKNSEIATSDKLMDYYFDKGAFYAWVFQIMPIGRGAMELLITPEQRLKMFRDTQHLMRDKKYFVADFWNCGMISNGCLAAGKGYLYVEWNGNVTPCVFNPYAVANINEIYKKGGDLDDVLSSKFFKRIRRWQGDYALDQDPYEMGNWILPCPIRDHYKEYREFLDECKPFPIDDEAAIAFTDEKYKKDLIKYDEELKELFDPIWEKEYLEK